MKTMVIPTDFDFASQKQLQELQYINLQLAALGQPICEVDGNQQYLEIAESLLKNYSQQRRLLANYRCPTDQRIQDFLDAYFRENSVEAAVHLPGETFVLEQ
jgi:nitrate/nitrite-specific signal transduction histidine kinase